MNEYPTLIQNIIGTLIVIFFAVLFRRLFYKKEDRTVEDYIGVSLFAVAIYIIYIVVTVPIPLK